MQFYGRHMLRRMRPLDAGRIELSERQAVYVVLLGLDCDVNDLARYGDRSGVSGGNNKSQGK